MANLPYLTSRIFRAAQLRYFQECLSVVSAQKFVLLKEKQNLSATFMLA